MIDFIAKSKIRKKMILLFIYNPMTSFFLTEIAHKICASIGTTQRELNRLLKNDFLLFTKKPGLKLYSLNPSFSLLGEMTSIITKTIGIEVLLKKELSKLEKIDFAFIFGSYVKGNFKSASDVDLFVIGECNVTKLFAALQKIEHEIGRPINYHIASKDEFLQNQKKDYFYKDILKSTILLKGNENEFRKISKPNDSRGEA